MLKGGVPLEGAYEPGEGISNGPVHVAAAIWLSYRNDDIEAQYKTPWQRIEAFRTLIRDNAGTVNGVYQSDLDDDSVEVVELTTGILDLGAVLSAGLPAAGDLAKETELAADNIG